MLEFSIDDMDLCRGGQLHGLGEELSSRFGARRGSLDDDDDDIQKAKAISRLLFGLHCVDSAGGGDGLLLLLRMSRLLRRR